MQKNYISIGIPIYNAEKYLDLAINSVIMQTHKYWELILVDDGSTDKSLEIANKYAKMDKRIRVLSDGENKKLSFRLNQIIDESRYDFIARMDADDIIHPKRLEVQLNHLISNPEVDLVSTGLVSINNKNNVYGYRNKEYQTINYENVQLSYPIAHATVLARKKWYLRNLYDTQYTRSEDYELWCRASKNSDLKVLFLADLLYYYREEGLLSAEKIINSYNDALNAYTTHYGKFDIKKYSKLVIKKNIVRVLERTGSIQYLARLRNKQKANQNTLKLHQEIVDHIISKTE